MQREIDLVQTSFKEIAKRADGVSTLFYMRLFELDPSLESLFPSDLTEQRQKLVKTLAMAVAGLNDLDRLVPVLEELGCKHVPYGVKPHMYDTVGEAILWTFETALGPDFTPETKAAWGQIYGIVATTMKNAAYGKTTGRAA